MVSYLLNAIPGAIVSPSGVTLEFTPVHPAWVPADVVSAIGHDTTAVLVSKILGREVRMNRISTPVMKAGDVNYVALYQGPRLPEGATELPEGASIKLYRMQARPEGWGIGECFKKHSDGYSEWVNCAGQFGAYCEMGGPALVWTCPCPCHAPVPATQEVR
jgi:hypothetical protein